MSDILGAIVTVEQFLSKKDFSIQIQRDKEDPNNFEFKKDRSYLIPSFQREIRWEEGNINMLLSDLNNGPQFLGNVILSSSDSHTYSIIDGQQRTTVLLMVIEIIRCLYGEEIETFELCPIINESFNGFQAILNQGFQHDEKFEELIKTDDYKQINRLENLWNELKSSDIINSRYSVKSLIDNIKRSELNIIYCKSPDYALSIRYFLDVNLKGVKLDKEDIFKGYLFSANTTNSIKTLWKENKQININLNVAKEGKEDKRYPLMKVYEHFYYCDLYLPKENHQDFSGIKFGEDFCLIEKTTIDNKVFYKGTHLIEAVCNGKYLLSSLQRIKNAQEIIIDIITSVGPSDSFKKLFKLKSGQVDSIEIETIHSILQKILLDKEVIPKVLVLKYILSYFDGIEHMKTEYKSIYSIYVACVFFTVFANKKESEKFYSFVKQSSWITSINSWLKGYISSHDLTRGKLLAAYVYSDPESEEKANEVRCKSLAAIYNFFSIAESQGKSSVKVSNMNKLNDYFKNVEKYSLEHLIVSKSGTLEIKTSKYNFIYNYPPQTKKYRNSLFNYIFIPRTINDSLDNQLLFVKTNDLKKQKNKVECNYSKAYLEQIESGSYFKNYPTTELIDSFANEDEVKNFLDDYFIKGFPEEFLTFSKDLTKQFNISF